ncbi:MAG TPA: AMP-binding protein [Conexibacter sp.]|jgi:fatty-acyl-CoA synthase|nr:AMP-binding protein [Conexibacter sp.]
MRETGEVLDGRKRASVVSSSSANLIWEAYETARDDRLRMHCWEGDGFRSSTWNDWRRAAERVAVGLRQRGVRPGTRVAAVLTNTFDVCAAVFGTWLAGGTLISLPTLRRGQPPLDYLAQLRTICQRSEAHLFLLERRFLGLPGAETLGLPVESFDALPADGTLEATPPADDDVAFVQYSSGSTRDPTGCMLTMGAISEQERMIIERVAPDEDTVGVTWLPLSHDMGFFSGLLLGWVTGLDGVLGAPERFLRQPSTWFDDCAAFGANLTMGPSFGLALATRRARTRPPQGCIPLRTIVLGGERIEWETLREADDVLGPYGVRLDAMLPAYGLAEAALAVTMKRLDGSPPSVRFLDADALYRGDLVNTAAGEDGSLALVSCGPPVQGTSVRIDGAGPIGQICVRSESMTAGYLDHEALTRSSIVDGELVTNDLGFLHDGELHVIGRTDDVITTGGRNVYARDAELSVERCAGVRPGCAALIDVPGPGQPRLLLAVETHSEPPTGGVPLAREMAAAAYRAVGLRVEECVFLAPGALPKTPSGKIQRFRCRSLLQEGTAPVIERVAL